MIKKDSLKQLISFLGYKKEDEKNNIYQKDFGSCTVKVDLDNEQFIYPEDKGLVVNDKTTSNFGKNENFVVFECVHRLLTKGYRPEHIQLEPKWQLGRDNKSGKADILIKDAQGNAYIIIECKTSGAKFNEEYKNTMAYGGQLFSYWQQEGSTKWLVLYASDWKDNTLSYKAPVICCTDDENIKKMSVKDKDILIFENATNDIDKFRVWKETYNSRWYEDLVFDEESLAYQVGIKPLKKKNLIEFNPDDKITNKFEEILRHNNVSDKENAFNRLVALFICKLVDEIKKGPDDIVDFQYKQGADTYESLQDRLQKLHQQGMEEFMKEKIFYVEADYAEKLFKEYTGHKRAAAIADLNNTIRILKFYSNNDFAFKDVHNEELFFQNGKILVEVVLLFQSYKIVYPSKHQFLGDLFEKLLNNGFKQNEGQFFTPTPITRFIWESLPLKKYIAEHGTPKIIDYSCGAGHFLTEGIEAINSVQSSDDNSWVSKHIYGIEKDYRLARVSKISMFMNGAGDSNIIFGDGLENYPEKGISECSFDILAANPPYAVEGFKNHLRLKNNEFSILDKVTDDGKEIETLFIERASQLIKPEGLAAIIMPDQILFKPYASYIAAREILYKHFKIKAIVRLKGKTFAATGKETSILFLEKYSQPPVVANIAKDFVDAVVGNQQLDEWTYKEKFEAYVKMQDVDNDLYCATMSGNARWNDLINDTYISEYCRAFDTMSIDYPKNSTDEEKEKIRLKAFFDYFKETEAQKLYYYYLAFDQKVVVIEAPKDNGAQKDFLGYDWTDRSGFEGIVIKKLGGKLFDPTHKNPDTLSNLIKATFTNDEVNISKDNAKHAKYIRLTDALDFASTNFIKEFTVPIEIKSAFPFAKLNNNDIFDRQIGKRVKKSEIKPSGKYPVYSANVTEPFGRIDNLVITDFSRDSILWGIDGEWQTSFVPKETKFYPTDHCGVLRVKTSDFDTYYVSMVLDIIGLMYGFSRGYRSSTERIGSIKIPQPPIDIQEKVAKQGKLIRHDFENTRMSIKEYRTKITNLLSKNKILLMD